MAGLDGREPDWLMRYLIRDSLCEEAYEATPALFRCAIKTAIALAFFHFDRAHEEKSQIRKDKRLGLTVKSESRPLDWAILCLPASFDASARICAAALLPKLAGVVSIICAFVGDAPSQNALVTLELCGIENLCRMTEAQWKEALHQLPEGKGKLFFVHEGELDNLVQEAATQKIPYLDERHIPILAADNRHDLALLKFAQGRNAKFSKEDSKIRYDAAFAEGENNWKNCRLHLGAGCECFWLFENYSPEDFRESIHEFGLLLDGESI